MAGNDLTSLLIQATIEKRNPLNKFQLNAYLNAAYNWVLTTSKKPCCLSSPATHTIQIVHREVFLVNWKSLLQLGLSGLSPISSDREFYSAFFWSSFTWDQHSCPSPFYPPSLVTSRLDISCSFLCSICGNCDWERYSWAGLLDMFPKWLSGLKQGQKVLASVAYYFWQRWSAADLTVYHWYFFLMLLETLGHPLSFCQRLQFANCILLEYLGA